MFNILNAHTEITFKTRQEAREYVKVVREFYGYSHEVEARILGDQQGGRNDFDKRWNDWLVIIGLKTKEGWVDQKVAA